MNQTSSSHTQIVAQWITSIAISVICCAVLFVVFARYIVNLNDSLNLITMRLELSQENQKQLLSELDSLRKDFSAYRSETAVPVPTAAVAAPEPVEPPAPATGVELSGPAPEDPTGGSSVTDVMTPPVPQIEAPTRKDATVPE